MELVQYGYHYSTEAKQSSTIIDPGVPPTVIRCICFHSVGCNRILSVSIGKKETFLLRMLEHRDAPPESLSSSCHDDNNNNNNNKCSNQQQQDSSSLTKRSCCTNCQLCYYTTTTGDNFVTKLSLRRWYKTIVFLFDMKLNYSTSTVVRV